MNSKQEIAEELQRYEVVVDSPFNARKNEAKQEERNHQNKEHVSCNLGLTEIKKDSGTDTQQEQETSKTAQKEGLKTFNRDCDTSSHTIAPLIKTAKAIKANYNEVSLVFDIKALNPSKYHSAYRVTINTIKPNQIMKQLGNLHHPLSQN